jgi:excinuclease ABC subunit C
MERQAVVLGDGTDADVVAFAQDELEAAVQVFHVPRRPGPRPARVG